MLAMTDLLAPGNVVVGTRVKSKRQLLSELAGHAAQASGVDQKTVLAALLEREQLGTTGCGDGVAIPHARLAGLERLIGLFVQLATPVEFDALDEQPVDLVFVLLVPEDCASDHLKALARVARTLREHRVQEALRAAGTADEAFEILTRRASDHRAA